MVDLHAVHAKAGIALGCRSCHTASDSFLNLERQLQLFHTLEMSHPEFGNIVEPGNRNIAGTGSGKFDVNASNISW
jgi:hypothetical protein